MRRLEMKDKRGSRLKTGLFIGALIGALVGIVLAPKSGVETRAGALRKGRTWISRAGQARKHGVAWAGSMVRSGIKVVRRGKDELPEEGIGSSN